MAELVILLLGVSFLVGYLEHLFTYSEEVLKNRLLFTFFIVFTVISTLAYTHLSSHAYFNCTRPIITYLNVKNFCESVKVKGEFCSNLAKM